MPSRSFRFLQILALLTAKAASIEDVRLISKLEPLKKPEKCSRRTELPIPILIPVCWYRYRTELPNYRITRPRDSTSSSIFHLSRTEELLFDFRKSSFQQRIRYESHFRRFYIFIHPPSLPWLISLVQAGALEKVFPFLTFHNSNFFPLTARNHHESFTTEAKD